MSSIFHGIANIFSGHSWGHTDYQPQQQTQQQQKAPQVVIPTVAAAPVEQAAPESGAQGSRPTQKTTTPSFLAGAALPNYGQDAGGLFGGANNGKSLLGQ